MDLQEKQSQQFEPELIQHFLRQLCSGIFRALHYEPFPPPSCFCLFPMPPNTELIFGDIFATNVEY